jgi:hypothetical protein
MSATDRFRIVLNPKLARKSDAPESLDYVEVVASRDGEVDRLWRVEVKNLVDLFDIIDLAAAVNVICDLRDGTAVTLPGDYSALHLILLGFRMPSKKAPRKSNIPNTVAAKFIPTHRR